MWSRAGNVVHPSDGPKNPTWTGLVCQSSLQCRLLSDSTYSHKHKTYSSQKAFSIIKKNSLGKSALDFKIPTKTPWHMKNVMAESSFWKVGDAEQLCFSTSGRRSAGWVMTFHVLEYGITLQMVKSKSLPSILAHIFLSCYNFCSFVFTFSVGVWLSLHFLKC